MVGGAITGSILGVANGELSFSAGSAVVGWRALMSSSTNLISLKAGFFLHTILSANVNEFNNIS